LRKYESEYMEYCGEVRDFVKASFQEDVAMRVIVIERLLSPFQYFLEDKIRLKRLAENRLDGQQNFRR
jgi:hypothetical protein